MERRKFLKWIGLAPLAAVAAKCLPTKSLYNQTYVMGVDSAFGPDYSAVTTIAVDTEWQPYKAYVIGQEIVISGNPKWNGKYKVVSAGTSAPNRSEFNGGSLLMEKI